MISSPTLVTLIEIAAKKRTRIARELAAWIAMAKAPELDFSRIVVWATAHAETDGPIQRFAADALFHVAQTKASIAAKDAVAAAYHAGLAAQAYAEGHFQEVYGDRVRSATRQASGAGRPGKASASAATMAREYEEIRPNCRTNKEAWQEVGRRHGMRWDTARKVVDRRK